MTDDFEVTDATDAERFELRRGGELVGFATYHRRPGVFVVPHVETLVRYRGRGYGARLMEGIVDILRRDGHTIVPQCPFAAGYLQARPDDADVVHQG